jgi:hypothetical protein
VKVLINYRPYKSIQEEFAIANSNFIESKKDADLFVFTAITENKYVWLG